MIKRKGLTFIVLIFSFLAISAQNDFLSKLYFDPAFYYGSVLPQNDAIKYLTRDHLFAWQLNAGISTNGSRYWHKYLNYPRLGVGYYHSNLGNDEIFGKVNAFYGTAAIKTFKPHHPVNLEHNLTAGVGFMTKAYYLHKNSLDLAFGSPVDFFVQYALVMPVRITRTFEMYGGACFTHCSAAKIVRPNYGLHMLLLRVGSRINLHPVQYETESITHYPDTSRHSFSIYTIGGFKQPEVYKKDIYWIYGIIPEYLFNVTHVFSIGAGFDLYYDNSLKPIIPVSSGEKLGFDQLFSSTAHLTTQLNIGALAFLFQPAIYLYRNDGGPKETPFKFGFRYRISDHFSADIMLKAHWIAHADFIELGMGYSFKRKSKQ
jgi:hypothetical protein